VDTGENTMTGGRLKRVRKHLGNETFCLTYGDGVSDIDIAASIKFHKAHGKLATLTAVQPTGRFGVFTLGADSSSVSSFHEKPKGDGAWVNGGFFVLEPGVLDYIEGDNTVWEREPMEKLSKLGQLHAWKHSGFWQPMDTLRDKMVLEEMWARNKAPWKIWDKP
jgi:glucose-1-phosphate cytidylyltransferase